jgi:sporulation protein YlmC with PRC-barrel domain
VTAHRLDHLLGAAVQGADGRVLGRVNDVRLSRTGRGPGGLGELQVVGLVVSDRHAGSMLGYDRRPAQGPWLVRVVVRFLHRRAGYVPWERVVGVDWEEVGTGSVVRTELTELAVLRPIDDPVPGRSD